MANLKFYFTPGSCSTGIHILLEEVEVTFEAYLINLIKGDQYKPEYLAINPRGTIPSLVTTDGNALTDFVAIALWIAKEYPRSSLLGDNEEQRVAIMEMLDFATRKVHGEGFTRIFTTDKYTADKVEAEKVREQGVEMVTKDFDWIEKTMRENNWHQWKFNIADAALFYIEFWAEQVDIQLPLLCQSHYHKMLKRPTVRQVLMEEGYHSVISRHESVAV
ncbi:glutathione transferase GstA [Aurantivibrio plasticivorans]